MIEDLPINSYILLTEGLDQQVIGNLASHKAFYRNCLNEFVTLLDFEGMKFEKGLRFLLSLFQLPGENE